MHAPPASTTSAAAASETEAAQQPSNLRLAAVTLVVLVKWRLDLIKETEMVFGNFEGKDVRSGSFTVEPF